jgi:hypothetical protein
MQPIGSFQIGLVTEYFGPQFAVALGGIVMLLNLAFLYYSLNKNMTSTSVNLNQSNHN